MTSTSQPDPDRLDRIERLIEQNRIDLSQLTQTVQQNSTAIQELRESIAVLTNDVTLLTTTIADYIVEAEEDRQLIKQNQADIKWILDYLHNRNGGSPPLQS